MRTSRRPSSRRSWSTSSRSADRRWHEGGLQPWQRIQAFDRHPPLGNLDAGPPTAQPGVEVAKLIDTSRCIGCKACQSACLEWNDMREAVGVNVGVYDNPHDLTPDMFTLMRFTEWENPKAGNLEWLIRKDGCMHCEDPGCLKACPAPGAIVQYANGIVDFHEGELHRLRLLREGVPVQHPAHLQGRRQGLQVHAVLGPGGGRPDAGLRQGVSDARDHVRHQGRDDRSFGEAHRGPQIARLRQGGSLQSAGRERHARHVRAASRRPAAALRRAWRKIRASARSSSCGRARPSTPVLPCSGSERAGGRGASPAAGANRVSEEDEAKADKLAKGREA